MIVLSLLVISARIPASFASVWQLGWQSTDPNAWYGIESDQQVDGAVPSNDGSFWTLVGFEDTVNYYWTNIELRDTSGGNSIFVLAEVLDQTTGVDHQSTVCSSLSASTYYNDTITWYSSGQGWLFKTFGASGCTAVDYNEGITSDSIDGGADDFAETNDATSSDFNSMHAYTESDYSMHYDTSSSGGSWKSPVWIAPWDSSAPSNIGVEYSCAGPWLAVDSAYAGPWSAGSFPTWACT